MANEKSCIKCKTPVSCTCQLKNGLCKKCRTENATVPQNG